MTRWCPACRKGWPDTWSVCGDCLAHLVADPDATLTCRHCRKAWPARMKSCPDCLAELQPDPEAAAAAMAAVLASGHLVPRPAGMPAFSGGPDCRLLRTAPRSSLLYAGTDEFLEAYVEGRDHRAVPPLSCHDLDGTLLFTLARYEAAGGAVVAADRDGTPMATYLRTAGGLDVRDETSAPVARLVRVAMGWELRETGGGALATVSSADRDFEEAVDDEWALRLVPDARLPVRPLAAVALLLAAKCRLGRRSPSPKARRDDGDDDEQGLTLEDVT